jgi:hypothetical protein
MILHLVPSPFADVARIIANGDPPAWLLQGLEYFSADLRPSKIEVDDKRIIKDMKAAADTLLKYLPAYQALPFGVKAPDQVVAVLDALPWIKEDLERLSQDRKGRKPNTADEICAAVVVEAWKLVHGKVERRSDRLYEACYEYWWASTGEREDWKDPIKWRRPVERAIAHDQSWVGLAGTE